MSAVPDPGAAAEPAVSPLRVCFVCSGNICRSPTAEAVLLALVAEAGLSDRVLVDSAGTGDWHAGDDMDARSRRVLRQHGYDHPVHVAKQFTPALFAERDLVVAIDRGHLSRLGQLAQLADEPNEAAAAVVLLRSFDPLAVAAGDLDVPDPYYGGPSGFEDVLAQIERACAGLLTSLARRLQPIG